MNLRPSGPKPDNLLAVNVVNRKRYQTALRSVDCYITPSWLRLGAELVIDVHLRLGDDEDHRNKLIGEFPRWILACLCYVSTVA